MKKNISVKFISLVVSAIMVLSNFTGCSQTGENNVAASTSVISSTAQISKTDAGETLAINESVATTTPPEIIPLTQTADVGKSDLKVDWDASATEITLDGTSISVKGAGATATDSVLTITNAGTYVISGKLENGQIIVNTTNADKVYLVLNGAEITNKTGAPIYASQCDKLIVTLAAGTQNTLTDGGMNYKYADIANEEPNAALFSKDDLTINGTGTLTINASFNNGIGTKDDLLIVSGNLIINSANHGLRGNDSITVLDGEIQITAGNDGIQTNNTEDADKGWTLIEGGKFTITAADDGIHADGNLTINAGDIKVIKSYEGLEAANIVIAGGIIDIFASDDALNAAGGNDGSGNSSRFGIDQFAAMGAYSIDISGGSINSVAGGDGIDSNGSLNVSGGTIISLINSSPDNGAIDCDGSVTFTGGTIIYGGTGTGSNPSGNSTQSYLYTDKGIKAGSDVSVQHNGKTLASFTSAINCQYLVVSTPDVVSGNNYDVYGDGVFLATVTAGSGGMMGGRGGGMRGQKPPRQ